MPCAEPSGRKHTRHFSCRNAQPRLWCRQPDASGSNPTNTPATQNIRAASSSGSTTTRRLPPSTVKRRSAPSTLINFPKLHSGCATSNGASYTPSGSRPPPINFTLTLYASSRTGAFSLSSTKRRHHGVMKIHGRNGCWGSCGRSGAVARACL